MLAACIAAPAAYACWHDAAARHGLSPQLLHAIARVESGLNPRAVGHNRNGSRDLGLMQINSAWLPTLAAHGITEQQLFDPCTSIEVGAWILAGNVARLGYTWHAVGAYNARSPERRMAYARRVHRELQAMATPRPAPRGAPPAFVHLASLHPGGSTRGLHAQ